MKVEAVYQTVSRVASDHARLRGRGSAEGNEGGDAKGDEEGGTAADGDGAPGPSSGALFEDIADAAHGVAQRVTEWLVDLRAQAPDVDIDDVGPGVEVHVPHLLGDEGAGEDVPGVPGEERQEQELLRRQIEPSSPAGGAVTDEVDLEIGDMEPLGVAARTAAQDRADAGQQLGEREGLHQVVVRSELEPLHAVRHGVAGGEKEDRGLLAGAAQLREDRPAVPSREHDVEDDQVVETVQGEVKPRFSVLGRVDDESALHEPLAEVSRRLALVLHE